MVRKYVFSSVAILIAVLTIVVGLALAQGPEPPEPRDHRVAMGTAFTYQGQLKIDGEPVDDQCWFAFRLYDDFGATDPVAEPITTTIPISVTEGLFTVDLDFGSGAFAGDARWLGIQVKCGSETNYTPLGRQELTAAPYAHYALSTGALQGYPITTTAPLEGQVLAWNGAVWIFTDAPIAHTHPGSDITSAVPTATYALQADAAAIASDVEMGVITPTHLQGITDNGASGQMLTSDGSGGFDWQAATMRQLVQDFVVAGGESVSAGDVVAFLNGQVSRPSEQWGTESVFNVAETDNIAVSSLSATDFVIAYRDRGNSDYGTALTGTVSGGTLSWGPESVFNPGSTQSIAVSSLSATDFVIAYSDDGNSSYGTALTGTVSGGGLSWGSESVFNAASTASVAVSNLSSTDFVVAYRDHGNSLYGTAIVGTLSGGTLSWGTESVFNIAPTDHIAVSSLSATDFVVAYHELGTDHGTARIGMVSGATLSWGPASVFNPADTARIAVSSLSSTDFVVVYRDDGNSLYGTAIAGTVSGSTLSWGPELVFNPAETTYIAVSSLSATDFVVAYRDDGNSSHGTAIVGTISGEELGWKSASVFNAANTGSVAVSNLSTTDFVVAYYDGGNSSYGTAIVGHHLGQLIGIAKTAAGGGETVEVIISGVSDVHSGLVPGWMYYLQEDGSLGVTITQDRVGLAISETELILDRMW